MRFTRSFLPLTAFVAAGALLAPGCSSKRPEGSLASGGTGASNGSGGSARGGSANGTSKGGSGGSSAKGGTTSATGGTGNSVATGGTGGTGNSVATGGTGNSTASGGTGAYSTDACEGLSFDMAGAGGGEEACSGVSSEAEPVAIDLFIMMDRSSSMAKPVEGKDMTRWEALQQAVQNFVDSGENGDIRAGIGFFGLTGGNDDSIDCSQERYSTPKVEIGPLDEVGADLVAAMNDMVPGGLTPEGPALAGALDHAAEWAKKNPGRVTAVVLVSDGYPTQCMPNTLSGLADIAERAHMNEPYVRTYVIGLASEYNLNAVAAAGGTREAFLVDKGDISASFASVLHNVANTKLACQYALPPSTDPTQKLDFEKVQVTYTTAGDETEEIPAVPGIQGCAQSTNGGWYYDNPSNPTSIMVCPCTCTRFDAGRVDVRVGCKPRVGVR